MPVGSNPYRLTLSSDDIHLLVSHQDSNQLTALNLDSGAFSRIGPVLDTSVAHTAVDPLQPERILLSLSGGPVALLDNGTLATNTAGFSNPNIVFDPSGVNRALGLASNRLFEFDIDAMGVSEIQSATDIIFSANMKLFGTRIYTSGGDKYDPATQTVELTFNVETTVVSVDETNDRVLFFPTAGNNLAVGIYDNTTGSLIEDVQLPSSGQLFDQRELLAELPDHIVAILADAMVIVPKSEVYP